MRPATLPPINQPAVGHLSTYPLNAHTLSPPHTPENPPPLLLYHDQTTVLTLPVNAVQEASPGGWLGREGARRTGFSKPEVPCEDRRGRVRGKRGEEGGGERGMDRIRHY